MRFRDVFEGLFLMGEGNIPFSTSKSLDLVILYSKSYTRASMLELFFLGYSQKTSSEIKGRATLYVPGPNI